MARNFASFGPRLIIAVIFVLLVFAAAYITHIVAVFTIFTSKALLLLIASLIAPPIGAIHGISIWAGYNWLG